MESLDRDHWQRWWQLLVPPRVQASPTWALAVVEKSGTGGAPRLLRLIEAGPQVRSARTLDHAAWCGVDHLEKLARTLGVAAVVAVERSLLRELSRQLDGSLRMGQDFVEQGLLALRALKAHCGHALWTYPAVLELLPTPSYEAVQRTFDLLVPDDSALVAYVIEDDRRGVHASVIARKRRGQVDRVTTHRALAQVAEAPFASAWPTAYPRVLARVEEALAKPSVGVFLERATLQRIITGPSDQLSRELSAKRVVIDPAPTWLLGLLGGATMAAVANRGARMLASMLPAAARDRASGLAQRASTALRDSGAHPFALLGFDPLELWARLQDFYR